MSFFTFLMILKALRFNLKQEVTCLSKWPAFSILSIRFDWKVKRSGCVESISRISELGELRIQPASLKILDDVI